MGRLIYSGIMSLDGYVADRDGKFDWSAPDEEVHAFVNDLERSVGTYLFGRRMYEVMAVWETMPTEDEPQVIQDYATLWRAAEKVVYSSSLESTSSSRTRIERSFEPDAVRQLVEDAEGDVGIGGSGFAGEAIRAGLIDEYALVSWPGGGVGGKSFLPDDVRLDL